MPLEIRPLWGKNSFVVCDDPKCIRLAGKRFFFMGHEVGKYCLKCAKHLSGLWSECSSVETVAEEC
jgi:hypothetical protein